MEITRSTTESCVTAREWRCTFHFSRDRWRHQFEIWNGDGWLPLLASHEGTPDNASPPSPAFQDLRLEQLGESTAEFQLFGQAGKTVYSAAIRCDTLAGTITADICARSRSVTPLQPPGSTYRISADRVSAHSEGGRLSLEAGAAVIRVEAVEGAAAELSDAHSTQNASLISIRASYPPAEPGMAINPRNVRWKYQVTLTRQP